MKFKVFYCGEHKEDFNTLEEAMNYVLTEVKDSKEDVKEKTLFIEHFEIYQVVFSLEN